MKFRVIIQPWNRPTEVREFAADTPAEFEERSGLTFPVTDHVLTLIHVWGPGRWGWCHIAQASDSIFWPMLRESGEAGARAHVYGPAGIIEAGRVAYEQALGLDMMSTGIGNQVSDHYQIHRAPCTN
jgi:hypothetical protein